MDRIIPEATKDPTPQKIRDGILARFPVESITVPGSPAPRGKMVGADEIVIFCPSGKKFSIKVSEITE